jgi:hypothetical protein
MKYFIFYLCLIIFPLTTKAQLLTSRLYSLAGSGVGSLLINESPILNPAPMAFAKTSTAYYQRTRSNLTERSTERQSDTNDYRNPSGDLFVLTDAHNSLKGGLSYSSFHDRYESKKTLSASFAQPFGENSSFGLIYRYNRLYPQNFDQYNYHQTVLGVTHVISESFSLGGIIVDPFKARSEESRVIAGLQYRLSDMFFIIADYGGNYTKTISDTAQMRGGIQLMLLNDFFFRFGLFRDKALNTKGDGIGIGWEGPRMTIDISYLNSKVLDENQVHRTLYPNENERFFNIALAIMY